MHPRDGTRCHSGPAVRSAPEAPEGRGAADAGRGSRPRELRPERSGERARGAAGPRRPGRWFAGRGAPAEAAGGEGPESGGMRRVRKVEKPPTSHFSLRSRPASPGAARGVRGPAAELHPGLRVLGPKQLSPRAVPWEGRRARVQARPPPDPLPSASGWHPFLPAGLRGLFSDLTFSVFTAQLTVSRGDLLMAPLPLWLLAKEPAEHDRRERPTAESPR